MEVDEPEKKDAVLIEADEKKSVIKRFDALNLKVFTNADLLT